MSDREECENGCALAEYGTHQEDCPHEPHDSPEMEAARSAGIHEVARTLDSLQRLVAVQAAEIERLTEVLFAREQENAVLRGGSADPVDVIGEMARMWLSERAEREARDVAESEAGDTPWDAAVLRLGRSQEYAAEARLRQLTEAIQGLVNDIDAECPETDRTQWWEAMDTVRTELRSVLAAAVPAEPTVCTECRGTGRVLVSHYTPPDRHGISSAGQSSSPCPNGCVDRSYTINAPVVEVPAEPQCHDHIRIHGCYRCVDESGAILRMERVVVEAGPLERGIAAWPPVVDEPGPAALPETPGDTDV